MSDCLWAHGQQHTWLPCPSPSPRVCSNSCPLSDYAIQTSHPLWPLLFLFPSAFPSIRGFSRESSLHIRRPKYWSFSVSPSSEYSGLISFRIGWFDNCWYSRDSQESSLTSQFKSINSLVLSLLYGPILTSIHDYWKNHSFDYSDFCQESNVSAF